MISASHIVTVASVTTMSGQLKLYGRGGHGVGMAIKVPWDVYCLVGTMHRPQNVYVLHVSPHNDRVDAPGPL